MIETLRRYRFLLIALIVVVSIYAISWHFARGGLHYFSPDTLDSYSQSEVLLIFTELPIYRSSRSTHRYKLVQYLINQGYWSPIAQSGPSIVTSKWNMQWRDGQSDFHRQFAWYADQWIAWTQQFPEVADELWADVLSLLRQDSSNELHDAVRLMHHSRIASTVEDYKALLESDPELNAKLHEQE